MSAFNRWWSSTHHDSPTANNFASQAWHSRDDEVAELKNKLDLATQVVGRDGIRITRLKAEIAELQAKLTEAEERANKHADSLRLAGEIAWLRGEMLLEAQRRNNIALDAMKDVFKNAEYIILGNAIKELEAAK